ncbi:MAG: deoxyribodipyrimidine photo-lyase [Gammaproteobacteria bacterium]
MDSYLLWFRRDLRLADNPALRALLDHGHRPIPVYIHDEPDPEWAQGAASAWWLHHSLVALEKALRQCGSDLIVLAGDTQQQLLKLVETTGAQGIYWNRCYEPAFIKRDGVLKKTLRQQGLDTHSFNGALLREPWDNLKKDATPYRVFTPFWKKLHAIGPAREPVPRPEKLPAIPAGKSTGSVTIDSLKLLPGIHWDKAFYDHWQPGEDGARKALEEFCDTGLHDYATARDVPAMSGTSRLSPHLHFGEISPVQIWNIMLHAAAMDASPGTMAATEAYLREIAWREFSHQLLYHFPHTPLKPLDTRFEYFPWRTDYRDMLQCWQTGQTGIPIVDAGMRELWATGYMHNRVRMIVASFLIKNLLIPWQEGARWFWDTLVDADLANNTMGWQWTAGSGADAAPYFRIFNPVLQGEKFDKSGRYVRHWIPELEKLADKYIHKPWAADPALLADAGVILGVDYPQPLVDLPTSRKQALAAWDFVKHQPRDEP